MPTPRAVHGSVEALLAGIKEAVKIPTQNQIVLYRSNGAVRRLKEAEVEELREC